MTLAANHGWRFLLPACGILRPLLYVRGQHSQENRKRARHHVVGSTQHKGMTNLLFEDASDDTSHGWLQSPGIEQSKWH